MAASDRKRYISPSRTYEFELKIGKIDLTPDLVSVTILTSIDVPYQTFILQFTVDPNDVILEQIYGQTPLKLKSRLYATSANVIQEEIDFELMYLSSDIPMGVSVPEPTNMQKDRYLFKIVCVSRSAYTTMNWVVNSVHIGQNLQQITQEMINTRKEAKLKFDTQGMNKEKLDQVLIPTSTIYKNLKYLNRTFGFYDGMAGIFCSHDNTVYVKNLTAKMTSSNSFVLYQLPLNKDNSKIIDKCTDGKNFYTTDPIQTSYQATAAFAYMAPKMKFIVKPKDRLYHAIDVELEDFSKKYGLISKGDKIFYDNKAMSTKSRVAIHKDHTGYELNENFIRAKYSRRVSTFSELTVTVANSMRILELMNVGEAVKLNTEITPTRDFTDMYLLRATQLSFLREKDWESVGNLYLIRTNKTTT